MFAQVLATEFMKLRRSKVTWGTLGGLLMVPPGIGLFIWIVMEPGRAAELGLLGTKAELSGLEATWPFYLYMIAIVAGIGGMLLLAFIVAYIFGREYDDETAKNMLALPVERHWFVLAKFVVAFVWWLVLVVVMLAEALVVGFALGLPGFSTSLALGAIGDALAAGAISYLLAPVAAWITTLGRGQVGPIGFALLMLGLGNLFGKTGWAVWFPWSIVPLLVGIVGAPAEGLPTGSYIVVAATFVVGVAATIAQVRWADSG
jgi:ABC-2 type transport system permease protein